MPIVSGSEWCCWVDPVTGAECESVATWALIDGEPAYDNCLDLCSEHRNEFLLGELFPLIVGDQHPAMTASIAGKLEAERLLRNTRKDLQ